MSIKIAFLEDNVGLKAFMERRREGYLLVDEDGMVSVTSSKVEEMQAGVKVFDFEWKKIPIDELIEKIQNERVKLSEKIQNERIRLESGEFE